jgi:hypothetical protein
MSDSIPKKPYYVTMTDRALSGWGLAAGKVNKLIIGCDTLSEAKIVADNAHSRSEMKYVHIVQNKPYRKPGQYLSYHDQSDYPSWFIPSYFAKGS